MVLAEIYVVAAVNNEITKESDENVSEMTLKMQCVIQKWNVK